MNMPSVFLPSWRWNWWKYRSTPVVAVNPENRDLVHGDSKFIVNSRLDVKFGLDGMQVLGASAARELGLDRANLSRLAKRLGLR